MSLERPVPDLAEPVIAGEQSERGEQQPGNVLADLETAGLPAVLGELIESGWTPSGPSS